MAVNDNSDGAEYPLFTFVDENIFKKETFLGECFIICTNNAPNMQHDGLLHNH